MATVATKPISDQYDPNFDPNQATPGTGGLPFSQWQQQWLQQNGAMVPGANSGVRLPGPAANASPAGAPASLIRSGNQNFAGGGGDWDALYGPKRAASTTPTMPGVGLPTGFPNSTVGTGNGDFYGSSNSPQLTQDINRLLDPNDALANYDVTMHGAENAIFRGVPGSGVALETTGRMRQADIERRTALGANLVNQAGQLQLGRDQLTLATAIQTGQLSLEQARLELQRQVQNGQLDVERARLALAWYQQIAGGGGGGHVGGGGNQSNRGGGGGVTAPTEVDPRTGAAFQSWSPLKYPSFTPRGASSATALPPIIAPENWDSMTPQQQADYASQYRSNQGNYGDNPWANDEGDWISQDWPDWYD